MPKYHTDNWGKRNFQMSIYNPDIYYYDPSFGVQEGDIIKIANDRERFWTRVVKTRRNQIIAEVEEVLFCADKYNLGDLVVYTRDNIYDFYRNIDKLKEIYKEHAEEQVDNIAVCKLGKPEPYIPPQGR